MSIWFGQKVAVTELSCSFGPGVTGLLGPNGAGKTTFMRSICGLFPTNQGEVRVLGRDPRQRPVGAGDGVARSRGRRRSRRAHRPPTGALHGVAARRARPVPSRRVASPPWDCIDVADRRVGGFSKGMRQRAKVAASLVTDPQVLVLDEPLNGADPVQRVALIDLFHRLGDEGHTVIVSSHVLHEVERLAARQIVIIRGRLAAAGGHRAIRDALADRPRAVLVRTPDPRRLASELLTVSTPCRVSPSTGRSRDLVDASRRAGRGAAHGGPSGRRPLREVRALDDSLESVFRELLR